MIKILFFIESLEHGGAEKSLVTLLKHLDFSKYEIEISTIKKEGALKNQLPPEVTFTHMKFNFSMISKLKFQLYKKFLTKRHNAQYFWKAYQSDIPASQKTYDVAVGWGQGFATYYVAEKVPAKKKIAWVNTNYDEAGYIFSHDEPLYSTYDKINGVSSFAVDIMRNYIDGDKLIQINNIIDEAEVLAKSKLKCPIEFDNTIFNIVSVGRLAKPKAFEISLQAAKLLKDRKVKFQWYIVGDGSEREFLETLRRDLSVENEITFVGFDTNPYTYMQQADLYVQTSRFEGLGRTLIEAAILKKPIVVTDFDTAFSLVDQYKTGIITQKDPAAVADAIYKLYENRHLYLKMVSALDSRAENRADSVTKKFDDLIVDLCEK
ncbi:hypothetical protein OA84_04715 [Kaistella solincola]|uniref:Glycosyl transferase family 1 domain-containing protein n=1 Tax=Kaistella solincola TaxID=510955 RepID=A0ABR4ZNK2_9FLAO|nr:glycosyltransferase [Kaistella solincola]KIA82876.1 hypothetical protein OA84_04715 [Kaistella solincola]